MPGRHVGEQAPLATNSRIVCIALRPLASRTTPNTPVTMQLEPTLGLQHWVGQPWRTAPPLAAAAPPTQLPLVVNPVDHSSSEEEAALLPRGAGARRWGGLSALRGLQWGPDRCSGKWAMAWGRCRVPPRPSQPCGCCTCGRGPAPSPAPFWARVARGGSNAPRGGPAIRPRELLLARCPGTAEPSPRAAVDRGPVHRDRAGPPAPGIAAASPAPLAPLLCSRAHPRQRAHAAVADRPARGGAPRRWPGRMALAGEWGGRRCARACAGAPPAPRPPTRPARMPPAGAALWGGGEAAAQRARGAGAAVWCRDGEAVRMCPTGIPPACPAAAPPAQCGATLQTRLPLPAAAAGHV